MGSATYDWIAVPFLTALICTICWGVRGAIVMFATGLVVPVGYTVLARPGLLTAGPLEAIGDSAFRIVYWWMATYVAAAIGLVLRPHLRDGP